MVCNAWGSLDRWSLPQSGRGPPGPVLSIADTSYDTLRRDANIIHVILMCIWGPIACGAHASATYYLKNRGWSFINIKLSTYRIDMVHIIDTVWMNGNWMLSLMLKLLIKSLVKTWLIVNCIRWDVLTSRLATLKRILCKFTYQIISSN